MTGRAATWGIGIVVSGIAHLGFGAALLAGLQPQKIPDQPNPKSTLEVTPEVVKRSDAAQQDPDSTDVTGEDTDGSTLGAGDVAISQARPQSVPQSQAVEPVAPAQATAASAPSVTQATGVIAPDAVASKVAPIQQATAALPDTALQSAQSPDLPATAAALPQSVQSNAVAPPTSVLQTATAPQNTASRAKAPQISVTKPAQTPQTTPQAAVALAAVVTPTVQPTTAQTTLAAPDPETSTAQQAPSRIVPDQTPIPAALPSSVPETTATKAVLAFPDAGGGDIDPASLAAFQSFTQPGAATSDPVRDNLQALLSLPCARMQVNFDPATTTLRLDGHVPDARQRGPVLAALQAQMGGNIKVTDNLQILPEPQCGALSGIANVGLPQSTDQITNPLIVGDDTHARSFRYIKDDPLVLELTGPDYPAYIYVDYFDADGNVIHLSPNAQVPLAATAPKEQLTIGARKQGDPGLMVIVGPPYGQEIAVAFAASHPLYTEARPLVEPADNYLQWLQNQVARTRESVPDFKGEWVYFFMQTAPE